MVAELPDRTVQYSLPVAGGRDGALCWLACLPWPQPQASHRGKSKEKAGGGGGGKEEKGDDAAARRRVDWAGWPSIGLDWIGRTARPRTAAAARIRCSGPDSVAHQVCRAAPRRAPPRPPGDLADRRDLAQILLSLRFTRHQSEHGACVVRFSTSASSGWCSADYSRLRGSGLGTDGDSVALSRLKCGGRINQFLASLSWF